MASSLYQQCVIPSLSLSPASSSTALRAPVCLPSPFFQGGANLKNANGLFRLVASNISREGTGRRRIVGSAPFPFLSSSSGAPRLNPSAVFLGDHEQHILPEALLFDCDGVLVDTERDGHRISFNKAFKEKGVKVEWGVITYGALLEIGGGKERMTHFFNKVGWPSSLPTEESERKEFIAELHRRKTEIFMQLVDSGALPLRPGVARLIDEALGNGIPVAVCSTSNERAVSSIVRTMLGGERAEEIAIFAGDVVPRKKPDPAIYTLASETLGVSPSRCVVIEDSNIGLRAAKAAGMACVVTKSGYTEDEDFSLADAVYDCIGDYPEERFGLETLCHILELSVAKA